MSDTPLYRQPIAIAGAVVLLHVGGLAALQSGLLVRAVELVVPVAMISQSIEPPKPEIAPPPPPAPPPPTPAPAQPAKQASLPPAPQPVAIADATPAPNAPTAAPAPPAPLPPVAAAVSPSAVAAPAPAAAPSPKAEPPRSDADYLNNPPPPYPPISRRMAEQGRVMLRVCVDEKGVPTRAEVSKSSGYERLDSAAAATAMRWRYKPGTRGGVAEAMCVGVPIDFKLD